MYISLTVLNDQESNITKQLEGDFKISGRPEEQRLVNSGWRNSCESNSSAVAIPGGIKSKLVFVCLAVAQEIVSPELHIKSFVNLYYQVDFL
jgi:hypothetical protein